MSTKYTRGKDGYFSTLVWDGTYNEDGSKHQKRIRSKQSSKDLENRVAKFKEEVENHGKTRLYSNSFYDYALHWLEVSKAAKEKNTQAMYRGIIQKHFSDFKGFPLDTVRHSHIQGVINENLNHPRTCQQIALTFKQIVKSAIKDGFLSHKSYDYIVSDIALPKYSKPQKRPLTDIEKEALEKSGFCGSSDRKKAFVSLLYYTGIRRGEALALTPFDFDWKNKTVSVNKVVIFDKNNGVPELKDYPKSDNGIRIIPMTEDCINNIKPFVSSCSGGFLFHGRYNDMMTLSAYNVFWKSIITELNMAMGYNYQAKFHTSEKPIQNLTAHVFRHNYCTELCYQVPNISTKKIAQLLGDTEKMVLDVYSHINEDRETVEASLEAALSIRTKTI